MSGLTYHHLDEDAVRQAMLSGWEEEREGLIAGGHERDCYGKDLSDQGWDAFLRAMPAALIEKTDAWLASEMEDSALWKAERWDK